MMASAFQNLLAFAARNERRIGAGLFALGFITDLLTFGLLPAQTVNLFFIAYLLLAAGATIGTHLISVYRERDVWWRKTLAVLFPLALQYAIGGLLSGFVVFYTKHSEITASWPFLLLLLLVYAGNEYFRKHKEHLIFQTVLFFFTLYAYTIFALPLYVNSIGPWVFLGSSVAAVLLFAGFLYFLDRVNRARLKESLRSIVIASVAVLLTVNTAYFTGLIPPVPLALGEAGIYHSVSHVSGEYHATAEEPKSWWDPRPQVIHQTPGAFLYAYSAVIAPISFSSTVIHRWERHDSKKGWVTENRIAFPITGGREAGYRGYSAKQNLTPGEWRVSIETPGGSVIGRVRFDIREAQVAPTLRQIEL